MRIVTVSRKPCSEGSTTQNVAVHGCGALGIDPCRIEGEPVPVFRFSTSVRWGNQGTPDGVKVARSGTTSSAGRWPANVILVGAGSVAEMDEQSGIRKTTWISPNHQNNRDGEFLGKVGHPGQQGYNDTGTASRFFKQVRQ